MADYSASLVLRKKAAILFGWRSIPEAPSAAVAWTHSVATFVRCHRLIFVDDQATQSAISGRVLHGTVYRFCDMAQPWLDPVAASGCPEVIDRNNGMLVVQYKVRDT